MLDDLHLNVSLLRRRVPNLTTAAKEAGLRPATVSNLCTGKIPVGRAEVRTLVTLAALAGCSLDELIIRGNSSEFIETGIKVIDLFAPVVRGGIVGLVARPGVGQLAVLAEMFRRLKEKEAVTIFWRPEQDVLGLQEIFEHTTTVCSSSNEVLNAVKQLQVKSDVILGADRSFVLSGEMASLRKRLAELGGKPITVLLVDVLGEAVDETVPYGPLDTLWRFDMDLAARRFFPAIDPVISTSIVLEGAHPENKHFVIQHKAKKLLRRYRELRSWVSVSGKDKVSEHDQIIYERGSRLESFLTQPFYVAEPFSGKPGAWVSPAETIEQVRRILEGAADERDPKELFYIGSMDWSGEE